MRRIVICGLPACTIFCHISHKRHDFWINITEPKMCGLIFCVILSETFLILKIIQRDVIKYVYRSACKVPVIVVSDFDETWIFSTVFRKILKYQISWKSVYSEPSCFMCADMTKLIVAFRNVANARHFSTQIQTILHTHLPLPLSQITMRVRKTQP